MSMKQDWENCQIIQRKACPRDRLSTINLIQTALGVNYEGQTESKFTMHISWKQLTESSK